MRAALEQNLAEPLSLASADFDEDGVPDLIGGYANRQSGIVTLHRGNVDALYPNSVEAQARRRELGSGKQTETGESPFLSPAAVFSLPAVPDFIGAGDFNADGHQDLMVATRGGSRLHFLLGDGRGHFGKANTIELKSSITTLVTGEINRADGLTDIVVGIADVPQAASLRHEAQAPGLSATESSQTSSLRYTGAQALVFEGPEGAMRATPEVFGLPAAPFFNGGAAITVAPAARANSAVNMVCWR